MDDCDVLRLDVVGNEVAGGRALQAVEADGAEDQLVTAGGDVRAGGSRGDHQDAFVLIDVGRRLSGAGRSEEHTSELQSLMRISNAVLCFKNKHTYHISSDTHTHI